MSRQTVEFKCAGENEAVTADPHYSSCKMNPYQTVLTLAVVKRALDDRLLTSIDLSEFRAIDDDAAEYLAAKCNHRELKLNGIENLTDRAASSLSKVGADLHLDGIKSLSTSAAASLAKHKKMLRLAGLKHLSVEAAEYLAYHDGTLEICIDYLPQASIDVFCQAGESRAPRQSNHHDQNLMHKPMGIAAILGACFGGGLCLMLQIQNGFGGTLWIGGLVLGAALGHLLDSTSNRGRR